MDLHLLGWNAFFEKNFAVYAANGYVAGRICAEHKNMYRVTTRDYDLLAQVSGKLRYEALSRADYPAVGDWVAIAAADGHSRATIHGILPRTSKFSRKAAGVTTDEQIVAANMDTVFLVNALNRDFNPRRIERYLTLVWESGANPVILLSKADLCADISDKVRETEAVSPGVPVHPISCVTSKGLDRLSPYLASGKTVALLGSSGAGKSTMINTIIGRPLQHVKEVREGDDKGRHTTTHRELVLLPQGGLIIDTPGMRELQLWGSGEGVHNTFEDIEMLARQCRFTDCRHECEPGCAVQAALTEGTLDSARYNNYLKMQKELAFLSRKENQQEYLENKEKWKKIHKDLKKMKKR